MGRCMEWMKTSTTLVVFIVFLSLFSDSLLLTLVDPILPDILARIDGKQVNTTDNTSMSIIMVDSSAINLNGRYGYLVAAKGAAQFFVNPFVGLLVTRLGYRLPMFIGDIILLLSTLAFGFGNSYGMLLGTRLLQGISSAVTAVTGMGLLAAVFTDDEKRGKMMGIAIGGISMGIIVGPIYGSVLYQFFGQAVPFIVVSIMIGLCLLLQIVAIKNEPKSSRNHSMTSILKLAVDPYILIVAGNIFMLNLDVSVILAFLPLRLIELENPATWKLGIVVLPTSIGYLLSSLICPRSTKFLPRWLCAMCGLILSSGTLIGLAFCKDFISMLAVTTFLGFALGMVSTSMQPIFAQLVDLRHSAVYGNVYAISDMSVCLAMFLGPLAGGPILYQFGFQWLVIGVAVMNLAYCQLCLLLRNPPAKKTEEKGDSEEENEDLTSTDEFIKVQCMEKEQLSKSGSYYDDYWMNKNVEKSEITPLLDQTRKRTRHSSIASSRTSTTMDLSHLPVPRYLDCLSAAEDLHPDTDSCVTV